MLNAPLWHVHDFCVLVIIKPMFLRILGDTFNGFYKNGCRTVNVQRVGYVSAVICVILFILRFVDRVAKAKIGYVGIVIDKVLNFNFQQLCLTWSRTY